MTWHSGDDLTSVQRDAERGLESIERFERYEQPEDLAAAIDLLSAAVASDPDISEPTWHYALSAALTYRSCYEEADFEADTAEAARILSRLLTVVHGDHRAVRSVMTDLCELRWRRYCALASPEQEEAAAEWLFDALRSTPLVQDGSVGEYLPRLLEGMAYLDRYRTIEASSDRQAGIDILEHALPRLPEDLLLVAEAWFELAQACGGSYRSEQDIDWLDRWVTAAARATALSADQGQDRLDFYVQEGWARHDRWENAESPQRVDLDRAIDCYALVLERDQDDDFIYFCHGDLLRQRGEEDHSVPDLDAAVVSLRQAIERVVEDREALTWYNLCLGETFKLRRELQPEGADPAAEGTAWAVVAQAGAGDAEMEVLALTNWIESTRQWLLAVPGSADALVAARAAVEAADAAADRIDATDSEWGALLAALLVGAHFWLAGNDLDRRLDNERIRELASRVHAAQPEDRLFTTIAMMGEGLLGLLESMMTSAESDYGMAKFDAAADLGADAFPDEAAIRGMALFSLGIRTGDLNALARGRELLAQACAAEASDTVQEMDVALAMVDIARAGHLQQAESLPALLARAVELSDALSATGQASFLANWLATYSQILGLPGPVVAPLPEQRQAGSLGALIGAVGESVEVFGLLGQALRLEDVGEIDRLTERAAATAEQLGPDHPLWPQMANLVALGKLEMTRRGQAGAAESAVDWGERGLAGLPGPQHVHWSKAAMNLAEAIRWAGGDLDRSRRLGLDAMRGRAWQALLQSGADEAVEAAHEAAAEASRLVGWCVADGAFEDLVIALEAGRGLVLHAAATNRRVTDQLRAIGAEDLAADWQRAGGAAAVTLDSDLLGAAPSRIPHDLRRRVLRCLQDAGAGSLLEPPAVDEIRNTVRALDLSALVYLVPQAPEHSGMAVVVAPDRPVQVLPMLGLGVEPGSPLLDYERAYETARDVGSIEAAPRRGWREQLYEVCDWAWQVGGQGLRELCGAWWPNQVPRLALIPTGALALVPWHAARRLVGQEYRYLAEDAMISTVASARLLCEITARQPRASDAIAIVSNPTGDLAGAGLEAEAIRTSFYPNSAYLGLTRTREGGWRPAEGGAATVEQVLDLIGRGGASGVLHLACHGKADQAHPTLSRLVLAGAEELRVSTLLGHKRTEHLELDRVFLSACTTHLSGLDYDEAFSLSTAFLAAGARTVFGSLWRVPDGETSVLMYMIHHYLNARNRPLDALHLAQRWMLDRDRPIPAQMPAELLDSALAADLTDPVAWAGFTHLGR